MGPVLVGTSPGRVYASCFSTFASFSQDTGQELWKRKLDSFAILETFHPFVFHEQTDQILTVGAKIENLSHELKAEDILNAPVVLLALDAKSGETLWELDIGLGGSRHQTLGFSLTMGQDMLFIASTPVHGILELPSNDFHPRSAVTAIRLQNRQVAWSVELNDPKYHGRPVHLTSVRSGNLLICSGVHVSLLDHATGDSIRTETIPSPFHKTKTRNAEPFTAFFDHFSDGIHALAKDLVRNIVYVAHNAGVYALDGESLAIKWTHNIVPEKKEPQSMSLTLLALSQGVLCFTGAKSAVTGLDAETGQQLWHTGNHFHMRILDGPGQIQPHAECLAAVGNKVLLSTRSWIHCLDLKNGKEMWADSLRKLRGLVLFDTARGDSHASEPSDTPITEIQLSQILAREFILKSNAGDAGAGIASLTIALVKTIENASLFQQAIVSWSDFTHE